MKSAYTKDVAMFLSQCPEYQIRYYKKTDNCFYASLDFIKYVQENNIGDNISVVTGFFYTDIPVHHKNDFTPEMLTDFKGNINSSRDRLAYIMKKYPIHYRYAIHSWVSIDGIFHDPSGKMQFIDTKLSRDMDISRYKLTCPYD